MSSDLKQARETLDNLRRGQLKIMVKTGVLLALAVALAFTLTAITIEAMFRLDTGSRGWLLFSIILPTVAFTMGSIYRIIRDPKLMRGLPAEHWWALALGRTATETLRDRLLNAIQISRESKGERWETSAELSTHALYMVVADLKEVPTEPALYRKPLRLAARITGISAAIFVIPLLLTPTSFSSAANRLLHPRTEFETPPLFSLIAEPGNSWAYRGEPVIFTVHAEGDLPSDIDFNYQYSGGQAQILKVEMEDGVANVKIDGFSDDLTYRASHAGIFSPEYSLDIVTRPRLADLSYRLTPPRYSKLPTITGPDNIGDIEGLPGSKIRINIEANKPLSEAWLVFMARDGTSTADDSLALQVQRQSGVVDFRLLKEASYQVRLRDSDSHPDKDPVTYRLSLLEDHPPSVGIIFPDVDIDLGDAMKIPVHSEAYDDFGISKLELGFRLLGQDTLIQYFELPRTLVEANTVLSQYMWDLGLMFLMPGDVIEFRVRAWDNDGFMGAKSAESETRLIRLPTFEEIIAGVDQTEQEGLDMAERTLEAAEELQEQVAEIMEEMKRNPEVDWERQQQLESAMEMQTDLKQQVEEVKKRIDELVEKLNKHDLSSVETLEKYEELQRLLAEVSSPELQAAMDKLRKAMESQDPDKLQKAMDEFDLSREQFMENIERTINILKQLQLERKLDELVKRTEELLHQQEELLSRMDRDNSNQLASEQESLAEQTEQLQEQLSEVSQLASELDESELSSDLDSLNAKLNEQGTSDKMHDSASNLMQGNKSEASQQSSEAARELSELASGLSQSNQNFQNRRKADIARKIRRLAQELMYISEAQEELATESHNIGTHSPRYRGLAGNQEDVKAALSGVIDRMFEVAKETFFITPDLGASLGKAVHQLDRALEGYSSRNPRSVSSPQGKALGEINSSTRQLLAQLQQLSGSSSSTGFEEMMQRLSDMANAQQGLNQQSSMPMPGMNGQPSPGGKMPGQQMSRLAAEQRALQQAMEEAANEAQGMSDILGDLEGIGKAMGEVAGDYEENKVTSRTRQLQRQIVSRLLDATRSVREKEYSRKRESRSGQRIVGRSPEALRFDSDKEKLRRDLLKALQEGYTRDYQQLIREYFQSLESMNEAK